MKLLPIVVIAIVAILLSHWTIKNLLSNGAAAPELPGDSPSDLLNYVRDRLDLTGGSGPELRISDRPKASNYYGSVHDSDIHHERTDLSKFFEVEQSVPDTKALLQQIVGTCASGGGLTGSSSLNDPQSGNRMAFNFGSDGTPTILPDQWTYENEKLMNGGVLDGVRGFDTEISNLSVYPVAATKADYTETYPYTQSFGKY